LTEQAVMEAVHNLGHRKTIIMIAHRLTTVRNCDNIFLLERGRLSAQGSFDELITNSESFRRMAMVDDPTPKVVPIISRALPSGGA
jgi:ABC-type multidrug transport system fused ATPase/permease subunit